MKYFKRVLPLMLSVFVLTSCAGDKVIKSRKEQTEIVFSWWGNDARNEYTVEAVEEFEKLYPDIKVKCSYSEWSGYEDRNRIQMVSDTEADVMQVNFNWLSQFSADGTGYYDLEKLTDELDLSTFTPDMLDYGRMNGILNAVPIAMNAETVYLNKSMLDDHGIAVPKTWDDIYSAAEVLSRDNIYLLAGSSKSVWLYSAAYAEQVTGKQFVNDDSRIMYNSDDIKVMIDFYCGLVEKKVMPQVEYFKKTDIDNGVYAGAVAWVSDAVNYFGRSVDNEQDIIAGDYTAFTADESGIGWYSKPTSLLAVSKNTEHPREAAIFLNYLLNSREMALLQGVEKGTPLSSDAKGYLEEAGLLKGLQFEASLKMDNKNVKKMNPLIEDGDMIKEFINSCNLVLYNKNDSTEAAELFYDYLKENFDTV